jgi:5-methylcytosine-specific restriction endonuclease McrA
LRHFERAVVGIFRDAVRGPADEWRHIIQFGRNAATYKFALGSTLLALGEQDRTFVPMEELAVPYAQAICEHLRQQDRQSTSAGSRFLDALRAHNRGEIDDDALTEQTVQRGFPEVIDAFHVRRGGESTAHRFFIDDRKTRHGITLTDELLGLARGTQHAVLSREVEARWRLVQTAWGLRLGARILSCEMTADPEAVDLYASTNRRTPVTGVRDALSGYQDGRCAYCDAEFTDIGLRRVAVDHVLPFVLRPRLLPYCDLHQVWNFVLACYACNSTKRDRPPAAAWMPWLSARNEYLIDSHHPLRETLIKQLGGNLDTREKALSRSHEEATRQIPGWRPPLTPAG